MKRFFDLHPRESQRILEILLPFTTWFLITLPVWLSPFHPAWVAYFLLGFDIYFFYKSLTFTIFSTLSYIKLRRLEKLDWLAKAKEQPHFKDIYHAIIITNYKESAEKVRKTLEYLKKQDFPKKKLIVVLAMEEREGEAAKERGNQLIVEFKAEFGYINAGYHPQSLNELPGKASNSTYAAKFISELIREKNINPEWVTLTSCDADSLLPEKYYSYLTYLFLTDTERYLHFYWAPVLLYSNFWEIPLPIRIQATLNSIVRLAILARPDSLMQISTYSMSLSLIERVGYWDTDIIPEDWHIFLQAFFALGERVKTIPIYLTVSRDAVNAGSFLATIKSRYEQEKRWAWGVTDVPYAIKKFFTSPKIPFFPKLFRVLYVIETHLFWPTSFFLLTLGASIPALVNPVFKRTSLGHSLPQISGFILTITTAFLLILIFIDMKSRPKRPASYSVAKTPLLLFQWILLPIISFFFSSLPALDAHTRLLLGKRLEYKVTEKK